MPGKPYLPLKEYYRVIAVSLPCSEWERVVPTMINHRAKISL